MIPLVIIGAGGFGRETQDVLDAVNYPERPTFEFLGFLDDQSDRPVDTLLTLPPDTRYVIAVGDGKVRARIDEWATGHGYKAATLVHPSVTVGRNVTIGEGSVVCAGVRLTCDITVGRHVHVNLNSTVGHDSQLGDYVTVFPLAAVSGNVTLGRGVNVGTGAVVLPGLSVGAGAFVGASSCVTKDVPAGVTVKGVPAK